MTNVELMLKIIKTIDDPNQWEVPQQCQSLVEVEWGEFFILNCPYNAFFGIGSADLFFGMWFDELNKDFAQTYNGYTVQFIDDVSPNGTMISTFYRYQGGEIDPESDPQFFFKDLLTVDSYNKVVMKWLFNQNYHLGNGVYVDSNIYSKVQAKWKNFQNTLDN